MVFRRQRDLRARRFLRARSTILNRQRGSNRRARRAWRGVYGRLNRAFGRFR